MSKILILVASDGKNLELTHTLSEVIAEKNIDTEIVQLTELNLPLYTNKEEKNDVPKQAKALAEQLKSARALLIVAPEYNGLMPPVLNNAICWISRSSENWQAAFKGKAAALATHSGSGGYHVLTALRQQLYYMGMNVVGQQLITNYKQALNQEIAHFMIDELIKISS